MRNKYKIFSVIIILFFIGVSITSVSGNFDLSENNTIIFDFTFQNPKISQIEINGKVYDEILIEGLENSYYKNQPCLPMQPVKILIPAGKEADYIEVITSEKITLGYTYNIRRGGNLVPIIQTETSDNKEKITEPLIQESLIYENMGIFIFRGFPILHINLYPVQYDSTTGEASYFKNIKLVINIKDSFESQSIRGLAKDLEIVKQKVDNPQYVDTYKPLKKTTTMDTIDYIIITSLKFKNYNGQNNFQDLLNLKESKGLNSYIVTVEEIMLNNAYRINGEWGDGNPSNPFYQSQITRNEEFFNDKAARIRNYIRYAYSELGTDYILLAGDADVMNDNDNIIPMRGLFANESGLPLEGMPPEEVDDIPSDVYYACLDGNFNYDCDSHFGESADRNEEADIDEADFYAEVWVGRACVDSEEEISNFVMKTINYEQITDDPYIANIMFVGEDLGEYYNFYFRWGGEYKDLMENLIPSQYNLFKFYDKDHVDNDWSPLEFLEEIYSVEPQIINHDGHGYTRYILKMWGDNLYYFENEKTFFIYSHSCLTGSFDNFYPSNNYDEEDCVAEILTCELPFGAHACILNARYGLGSEDSPISPSGAYDESFFKALFTENIKELGPANHYSKEDNIWRVNQNGFRWALYQTNLFGDPNLRIKDPSEQAPNKPARPTGTENGRIKEEYTYQTTTTDPNGDEIWYLFDWGDDTNSDWVGPFASGEVGSASHTWSKQDNYQIRAIAKNENGVQSEWSDPLTVNMPKYRQISLFRFVPILRFLFQRFPILTELFLQ
jgi:hypothetical protein